MSPCCCGKITSPYIKCFGGTARPRAAISPLPRDSRINWTRLCFVFDWQVAPEFSFDGRSHIQLQLSWSLPARQTRVQVGVRTRAATGVILSLLSQEQTEYLRLEVSQGPSPPPWQLWLSCLWVLKWWLGCAQLLLQMLVRLRVNNIGVGDTWVDTEGAGDWHMYVPDKVF